VGNAAKQQRARGCDRALPGIGEFGIIEGVNEVLRRRGHHSLTMEFAKNVVQWMSERRKESEGTRATKTLSQCDATLRSGKRG